MVSITRQKHGAYGVKHFTLDTEDDFKTIRKDTLFTGSTAYVISTGNKYIVNGNLEWKEINSSSGGGGDVPPSEDKIIIYDGGEISGGEEPMIITYDGGEVGE